MTIETEVLNLTTKVSELVSTTNVNKQTLTTTVSDALTQLDIVENNLSNVNNICTAANSYNLLTIRSSNNIDLQTKKIARSLDSVTDSARYLSGLSQSLHFGTVVDVCIDEPLKHSDGGAWTDRCADKSWHNESLGGDRWIGQRATVGAAWTAAGSAVGAVYQATTTAGPCTAGRFYQATSATAVNEVFRGITKAYPKSGVVWVAETGRVIGYELITGAMWMVFSFTGMVGSLSSIATRDGVLCITNSDAASFSLITWAFPSDTGRIWSDGGNKPSLYGVLSRLTWLTTFSGAYSGSGTASAIANDVAITVLQNAPIDPATGLPTPTIAVATGSGTSVIKHDGTVLTAFPYWQADVNFDANNNVVCMRENNRNIHKVYAPAYTSYAVMNGLDNVGAKDNMTGGATMNLARKGLLVYPRIVGGITVIKDNYATFAKGMAVNVGNNYNTGWQVGDSRLATLCSTVAESVSQLTLANEKFTTSANGWTSSGFTDSFANWTPSGVSCNSGLGSNILLAKTFPTIVGKSYRVSAELSNANSSNSIYAANSTGTFVSNMKPTTTFVATQASTRVAVVGGASYATATVKGVSIVAAEPDYSVKANGLTIKGKLAKTPVAAGAALVAYSGFSAVNYLEQPYSVNLDFDAGDFHAMGWIIPASNIGDASLLYRGADTLNAFPVNGINIWVYQASTVATVKSKIGGIALDAGISVPVGLPAFACITRVGGVRHIYMNGVWTSSVADTTNLSLTAPLLVGKGFYAGGCPMALWRIGFRAPTADQIAQIYRDELALFQPGAQCTVAGSGNALVTAMAYDDSTDLLHVGTAWGRSAFRGLQCVYSEVTRVGAITALAASNDTVVTGGFNGARITRPQKTIMDEMSSVKQKSKALVYFDYDAVAAQTSFVVPKGYSTKIVYSNKVQKRKGTTKDYTITNDGYQETVVFNVAPGAGIWVSIAATLT